MELTFKGRQPARCYIASHFFNPKTLGHVEKIKSICEELGIGYFSPKDAVTLNKDSTPAEQEIAFRKDVEAIDQVDFLIGNTSEKDQGSHFEFGYAFARDVPIIYVWPDDTIPNRREMQFNLMLAKSGLCVCYDFDELKAALKELIIMDFNFDTFKREYQGAIE